jgi:apolipoprotein N-acyltransferase
LLGPDLRTAFLAACIAALALWASAPPLGLGALAWVALVPAAAVFIRWPGERAGRAVIPLAYALYLELLLVPALPFGLTNGQWGETPIPVLVGGSPVVPVALLAVPLFGCALWAIRFPHPWPGAPALAAVSVPVFCLLCVAIPALSWTALDLTRTKLDPGGLWGPLFISQAGGPTARLGALGGPWLVTFAIVAVNYAIALALVKRREGLPALAVVGALAIGLFVFAPFPGASGGRAEAAGGRGDDGITVAAVQPGYDTAELERLVLRWFRPGTYDLAALDTIRDLGRLTGHAARRGAELVVWPEAALWVDPRTTPRVRAALARLARSTRATIVVPYFLRAKAQGATVSVSPGTFSRPQPKQRPMWFWGEDGDNRVPPRPVDTSVGAVGTTLGVDNQDPAPARLLAARGARVLSSSTHDWKQLAPAQAALARSHAAELETPVVRSDWRFGSAVFDAGGDELAGAGDRKRRTVVVARVEARSGSTPYMRIGDAFGWVSLAGAGVLLMAKPMRAAGRLRPLQRSAFARSDEASSPLPTSDEFDPL